MTAHETLGVKQNATQEEIKRAYRQKSKTAHPDQGGTEALFQQLRIAYDELTGRSSTPVNAAAVLSQLYASMLSQLGEQIAYVDIQTEMRRNLNSNLEQVHQAIQQQHQQIKLMQRLNKNCNGPSIILDINNGNIAQAEKAIIQMKQSVIELEECLKYVEQINYTPEQRQQTTSTFTSGGWHIFQQG